MGECEIEGESVGDVDEGEWEGVLGVRAHVRTRVMVRWKVAARASSSAVCGASSHPLPKAENSAASHGLLPRPPVTPTWLAATSRSYLPVSAASQRT